MNSKEKFNRGLREFFAGGNFPRRDTGFPASAEAAHLDGADEIAHRFVELFRPPQPRAAFKLLGRQGIDRFGDHRTRAQSLPFQIAQQRFQGISGEAEVVLALARLADALDHAFLFQKPRVGADAAAADLQFVGQLAEGIFPSVEHHQAHEPACDPRQTFRLRHQAHLLDEALTDFCDLFLRTGHIMTTNRDTY